MATTLFIMTKSPHESTGLELIPALGGEEKKGAMLFEDSVYFTLDEKHAKHLSEHVDEIFVIKDDLAARGKDLDAQRGGNMIFSYDRAEEKMYTGLQVAKDPGVWVVWLGCALMVVFGFVANRLNVSITGMEAGSGVSYIPKWTEVAITLAIVALGFAIFRVAAQYLPIFEEAKPQAAERAVTFQRATPSTPNKVER